MFPLTFNFIVITFFWRSTDTNNLCMRLILVSTREKENFDFLIVKTSVKLRISNHHNHGSAKAMSKNNINKHTQ